jgi:hypothetical protein
MGTPEEIPNIEQFPISPRSQAIGGQIREPRSQGTDRPLTPMRRATVEFWNPGEDAQPQSKPAPAKANRITHSKRADRLGILMAVIAIVLVVLVWSAVKISRRNAQEDISTAKKSVSPVVDFYLGNRTFSEKVKKEKSHNDSTESVSAQENNELQVSLQDQMASMQEKLEKMRSEKLVEEPPLPQLDKGDHAPAVIGVAPADVQKFNAPLEFNGMLPKPLQETK